MIQLAPQMRILVAIEPVDLRKGIDGLAQLCRERLGAGPFSGYLFIFRGRRRRGGRLRCTSPDDSTRAKTWPMC